MKRRRSGDVRCRRTSPVVMTVLATLVATQIPGAQASIGSVPVDIGFTYDGRHSDFAQQYYVRSEAGDSMAQLDISTADLPDAITSQLTAHELSWTDVPGILQRAMLWDAGYALTRQKTLVTLYTRCGRSMAEIFVSHKAFRRAGCASKTCSLVNGTEVFYRHRMCQGDVMATFSLCAADGADAPAHAAPWGDGGESHFLPEVTIMRHAWHEDGNNYLMYGLHTAANEVAMDQCPSTAAMVIPCVPLAMQSKKSSWCRPVAGKIASAWLAKFAEDHQNNQSWLFVPAAFLVLIILGALSVYRFKAAIKANAELDDSDTDSVNTKETDMHNHRRSSVGSSLEQWESLLHPTEGMHDMENGVDGINANGSAKSAAESKHSQEAAIDVHEGESNDRDSDTASLLNTRRGDQARGRRGILALGAESSRRNEIAARTFQLFESHRRIRQLRVPLRDLHLVRLLSQGSTGEVWLAMNRRKQVALKQLIPSKRRSLQEMGLFMSEIYLLSQLKHVNIVSLVGVAWNTLEHVVMVQEYMPMGDLQRYLAAQKQSPDGAFFSWNGLKSQIALGIANALVYMHGLQPKLLHLDVKSKNVLLSEDIDAKLCDFGTSRRKRIADKQGSTITVSEAGVGTMPWTAPELLLGEAYTEKADIYSFGVLLTEIDTCTLPYHDVQSMAQRLVFYPIRLMRLIVHESVRPKILSTCPPLISHLVSECLARDPERRPSAQAICATLRSLVPEDSALLV